jgi:hypothetical protein
MKSLANQGMVLENELARLELAWYSLAAGVAWQDLARLPDAEVSARRDSLARAEKGALEDARRDLGTLEAKALLEQTLGNVDGMASLLALFDTGRWSSAWEKKLARAAGQVSPTASRMTRAYANSAYALLSLKKAERREQQAELPYLRRLEDEDWPSAETRSLLTNLRAQVQIFSDGQAPALLRETLDLYADLKKPASLAARAAGSAGALDELAANRAVKFHPEAYGDFLERVRFEAALIALDGQEDPGLIPEHLYEGAEREMVVGFRDTIAIHHTSAAWDSMSTSLDRPFLARWAKHLGKMSLQDLAAAQGEFDAAWVSCRKSAVRLQEEADAGRDWTATWLVLNRQARDVLARHGRVLAEDRERSRKMADLNNLLVAMGTILPLEFQAGTIRLDSDRMLEGAKARLEIRLTPDGHSWQSDKFYIGPAAPDGAGWVGTVSLEKEFQIRPDQGLEVRVVSEKNREILLEVICPSLEEGTGPGGMTRPRSGGRGSVSLKIAPSHWRTLRIPDLGMIF